MVTAVKEMKCEKCGTASFYFRQILQVFVCRKCGHTWPK